MVPSGWNSFLWLLVLWPHNSLGVLFCFFFFRNLPMDTHRGRAMVTVYLIQKRSWWSEAVLNPHPVPNNYLLCIWPCWVWRGLWSWTKARGGHTASHPRTAVFSAKTPYVAVLPGTCGCAKAAVWHIGLLLWPAGGQMCAPALLLLNSVLSSALGPLAKVQSVRKMVFHLPSALPCLGATTVSFFPVEKYVIQGDISPLNPDKQLHIKTCYLQLKDYPPPLSPPTKKEKKKEKRSNQILNTEMLRKEQQVKDWVINSFPDSRGSSLPARTYACTDSVWLRG